MVFRVHNFSVSDTDKFITPDIQLCDPVHGKSNSTYFSVIIGNNGTGKTRYLQYLVHALKDLESAKRSSFKYFIELQSGQFHTTFDSRLKDQQMPSKSPLSARTRSKKALPSKLIALTTSLSDRFPTNTSKSDELPDNIGYYSYIGSKNRANVLSVKSLMDRALKNMLGGYFVRDNRSQYRHIFEHLGYKPRMKISFQPKGRDIQRKSLEGAFTGVSLRSYVERKTKFDRFRTSQYRKAIAEFSREEWDLLADLYHNICISSIKHKSGYSLELHFSENVKETAAKSIQQEYLLLERLRAFELLRGPLVTLSKKTGGEFDFEALAPESHVSYRP